MPTSSLRQVYGINHLETKAAIKKPLLYPSELQHRSCLF
jgi:hypothetical protein